MEPHNDTIPANIAIIGMACRLPGADDIHQYWRNVREGVESIRTFTDDELRAVGVRQELIDNPRYVKASAPIADVEGFDAGYFGYVARDVEVMDPQHRIFLECAVWAMEDAGYDPTRYPGLIGVYGGSTINTYLLTNLVGNRRMLDIVGDHATMISNDKDYLPLRVAYKLGLRGPAYAVQTACSTSLTAVHVAAQAILSGECDMAIAGGASVRMPHGGGYLPNPTASPDGHCRTFDAGAQGSVMGNGAGIVVLKHLDDAVRDGDHVYAVIAGSAINNDGREKSTFTAPSVDGQARAAASALAAAGLSANDIDYVEAHGTATPLGDPIEVAALTKAYRLTSQRVGDCAIGSVKPNIGHLDAAAGVASLIKTVMALRHRAIPPVVHFTSPNPQIDFDASPFYVPDELVDWPAEDGRPRRAGVHSLGMGGSNAHVVLEEAPVTAPAEPAPAQQLLVLSAKTETALSTSMTNLAHWLREHPAESLADVAFTLQVGRAEHGHRCAVVARDTDDAASALGARGSSRVVFAQTPGPARRTVFLMPGQGTQYVGMGAELYRTEPVYRETVDECLELVSDDVRETLRTQLLGRRNPSSTALTDTALAQPALFIVEYALACTLESFGVRADLLLGHSIGEYAAATIAGVFALRDALAVVCARGRLISGLPGGAMLSVPLPEDQVRTLIEGCAPIASGELSIAAVNAASMVVVAGTGDAIAEFEATLAAQHVPGRRLHVSHAFHSAQMDPILADFEDVLRSVPLNAPARQVVSNVTGEVLDAQTATDPGYWVEHLRRTVRFADGVDLAVMEPGTVVIEVGPAGLAALVRHQVSHATDATVVSLMPGAGDKVGDRVALLRGLGALWQSGVRIDWEHTHAHRRRRVPLPTYPFERIRHWVDVDPDGPALAVAQPARSDDPLDWVYEPRWTQCESITAGGGVPDAVLVLCDDLGVGDRLAQRLRAAGSRVVTVRRGSGFAPDGGADIVVDPARPADWDALAAELVRTDFRPEAIVHAWTLDAPDDFDAEQTCGLYSLPHLLRLSRTPDADLLYVTRHGFDVTGEDPSDRASPPRSGCAA